MRRVLILSYYFPPSGGPGVQRVLKFTRYLPETGWMPTVVTVDPKFAAYPNLDPDLEKEVPEEVLVHRTRSWDPYALYARVQGKRKEETVGVGFLGEDVRNPAQRFGRWLRANVFLPDARVGWMPFCVREAVRLTRSQPFDAIISSGPPHSVHLSGLLVQRWTGLPWLADFRDPWTEIDFYQDLPMTAAARAVDRAFERLVLGRANGVSVVGPAIERMYREKSDGAVRTIFNGYDEQDFSPERRHERSETFDLVHVGNMNAARNPVALWEAIARLHASERFPELRIRLVGNVDPAVLASLQKNELMGLVRIEPYVTHSEAVAIMTSSPVLLLTINRVRGAEGILTGKIFEYLAAGGTILGIGPPGGDAADVIEECRAGEMIDYDDVEGAARVLEHAYDRWQHGAALSDHDGECVARFSRRRQTIDLAGFLDELVGDRRTFDSLNR